MRYYIIAGEASGDLHASVLIRELRRRDPGAEFRGVGGDLMAAQGALLAVHYRSIAYMGLLPVMAHLPAIARAMRVCRRGIDEWRPHALILVDYPGFNMRMARYARAHTRVPVFYYIAPKLWAWREYRAASLRRDVDRLFSILPFEVPFFRDKHRCAVSYVGNPTADEVREYREAHSVDFSALRDGLGLSGLPVLALLPGSRRQEIMRNLPLMARAAARLAGHCQAVVAAAPGVEEGVYTSCLGDSDAVVAHGETYRLLHHSAAALVVSGTATLEAALFRVPQVVCYATKAPLLAGVGRRLFIKTPYVSLVNLVAGAEVVPELVADKMTLEGLTERLASVLQGGRRRDEMMRGYELVASRLGETGAAARTAEGIMTELAARFPHN